MIAFNDRTVFFMAYIFIVKYNVLFGLFNFGLGLALLNLASASTSPSRLWPRPQMFGLGLKHLASFNISAASMPLCCRVVADRKVYVGASLISIMYQKTFAATKVCNFQPLAKFTQLMARKMDLQ